MSLIGKGILRISGSLLGELFSFSDCCSVEIDAKIG